MVPSTKLESAMTWLREIESMLRTQISNPVRGAAPQESVQLVDAVAKVFLHLHSHFSDPVPQRIRLLFRILVNKHDDKHECVLALIISMKHCSAISEFFEDIEELCDIPASDRISWKLKTLSDGKMM